METYVSGPDVTRRTLIEAALKLFGERGYDAVSTREIADHAAANIGSIAYHFGGKPGLRQAAAEHVITTMRALIGPALSHPLPRLGPAEALTMLEQMTRTFVHFLVAGEDGQLFLNFMLREVLTQGEILDKAYAEMMRPTHARICELFALATGLEAESEETKILVFTMIGQCFYFHIGRPLVMRRMDWDRMGKVEADKIHAVMVGTLRALVAQHRKS